MNQLAALLEGATAVHDVPSSKQQYPTVYTRRKMHIHIGNPGMYSGCPLTTTTLGNPNSAVLGSG